MKLISIYVVALAVCLSRASVLTSSATLVQGANEDRRQQPEQAPQPQSRLLIKSFNPNPSPQVGPVQGPALAMPPEEANSLANRFYNQYLKYNENADNIPGSDYQGAGPFGESISKRGVWSIFRRQQQAQQQQPEVSSRQQEMDQAVELFLNELSQLNLNQHQAQRAANEYSGDNQLQTTTPPSSPLNFFDNLLKRTSSYTNNRPCFFHQVSCGGRKNLGASN